jgi:hypothetical protein
MPRKLFLVVASGLLVLLSTGCIVSMEPETATNPVGTEHTVTVTLEEPDVTEEEFEEFLCELFEELLPEEEETPCTVLEAVSPADHIDHDFEVIDGPNAGTHSEGGDIIIIEETPGRAVLSWTYTSNGIPGRDLIRFCDAGVIQELEFFYALYVEEVEEAELTEEEFFQFFVDFFNDALDTEYEDLEDMLCETVTKTWVDDRQERSRPNIGAGLSGLFQGQPTALPTAPAPVATAPNQGIRPPNTGDGGLR